MSTKIQWTEETWNPFGGCSKVSSGCRGCYAEVITKRLAAMGIQQCQSADVPVFVKQLGAKPYQWVETSSPMVKKILTETNIYLKNKKGGDWNEFPLDLQIRQMPKTEI